MSNENGALELVIASEAKQSRRKPQTGLLRRFARNDELKGLVLSVAS
jgi:hypothetical protein